MAMNAGSLGMVSSMQLGGSLGCGRREEDVVSLLGVILETLFWRGQGSGILIGTHLYNLWKVTIIVQVSFGEEFEEVL